MAVHTDHRAIDIGNSVHQRTDHVMHLSRCCETDRVGDIHRRRPGVDHGFYDAAQKVNFGASGVFGRELNIVTVTLSALDALDGATENLIGGHLQLELPMDRAGGQKDVYPRVRRMLKGLPGSINIFGIRSRQSANLSPSKIGGDLAHGLEISRRCNRKTSLDNVHAEIYQRLSNLKLLL